MSHPRSKMLSTRLCRLDLAPPFGPLMNGSVSPTLDMFQATRLLWSKPRPFLDWANQRPSDAGCGTAHRRCRSRRV